VRRGYLPTLRELQQPITREYLPEAIMKTLARSAVAGFVLLLPALILVSAGLLELEVPSAVVHPVLVMGGLFVALALNALSVFRIRFGREGENVVGTISLRVDGAAMNLAALALGCLLLAAITAYLFVENFQPRPF
jgi:hypothetical protein